MKLRSQIQPVWTESDARSKLSSIGQEHLLCDFHLLNFEQRKRFLEQIYALDTDFFHRQQEALKGKLSQVKEISALTEASQIHFSEDTERGHQLVQEGKVALVVLAGGQGSRLRCLGPKGCVPITLKRQKTLFQFLAEKILAASIQAGCPLEAAIMTSPLNHQETKNFFAENAFFGLDPSNLSFFSQHMWPMLDLEGNLFLDAPGHLAEGPNGNGGVFRHLVASGIWQNWKKKGIQLVNVIPIDNPLAQPYDFSLFGLHERCASEVTIKTAERAAVTEKVGVLAQIGKKTTVIEYLDLREEDRAALDEEGRLKYRFANLGLYCFSLDFVEKASLVQLPLHVVKKVAKLQAKLPHSPNAWKFEEFIFDVLPLASKVNAALFTREACFAPLKNLEGEDSINAVQEALLKFDHRVFAQMTGNLPPKNAAFELAPAFYYPTTALANKWKGKSFPGEEYIHD